MKEVKVGLIGCGTVGTGVCRILIEKQHLISSRVGASVILKYVADLDTETDRGISFDDNIFIKDAFQVIGDPEIDIIIELIGGKTIAKELILKAIEKGKHVVTANKALLAEEGEEIFQAASEKGVSVAFEASAGGCIPIVKTIRESLIGNRIKSMTGILNGTCNYILTKIADEGLSFKDALAMAQKNGFAEADPTLDIEGGDTAHKISLLSTLSYGTRVDLNDVYIEGITGITPLDIEFADEFGYKIKLLAISKALEKSIEVRVHPAMISCDNPLASVHGSLNAVSVTGDATGEIVLYGYGAGMMPTASAVVSDIVDIARDLVSGAVNRLPSSFPLVSTSPVLPIDELITNYYFRFSAADKPGVLSKIAGILGAYGISVKSVHQKGRKSKGPVPIVMLTHIAREADVQKAISEIDSLDVIDDNTVIIRIESDQDEQE
ncbi:MAG: homoserine dehydrogenase [Deltaproteobacteria bacterium]|nr:homoserine dehydrogenase [Deltaproteobacteria bacterium]